MASRDVAMSATLTFAGRSAVYEAALDDIDEALLKFLKENGMHELHVIGFMFGADSEAAILIKGRMILETFGAVDPEDRWPGQLAQLANVARKEAVTAADRLGHVSELELSIDAAHAQRVAHQDAEAQDLRKLAVPGLSLLPTVWKGKRYRRREAATNEHERAQTYLRERAQEGRRVMSLIQ